MFLELCSRWNMDTDIAGGDAAAGPSGDRVVILSLEESLRFTDDQCICRGEFVATDESAGCEEPLVIMLPVVSNRVRLVCFDAVIDCHDGSDIEST